jgi:hypothetical protein
MQNYTFEHETLLNGTPVTVEMSVTWDKDWDEIDWQASFNIEAVWFDGTNVMPLLTHDTITALEMEAESGHIEDSKY